MNLKQHLKDPIFKIIRDIADDSNLEVYVVGGFVRDILLNRIITQTDLDFVCIGDGINLAKNVNIKLGRGAKLKYFKNFGTAMIHFKQKNYEFIGARKESYRKNSRKPIVEDGTLSEDQNRRDFTINAMSISLNRKKFGKLIDPFNGVNDLKEKVIKTPIDPNRTYSDDPLRMIRAIRFASQLEFKIDEKSLSSIQENVKRLSIVSQERVTDEINKILLSNKPSIGLNYLYETKLFEQFFPEIIALHGTETKNGFSHKDNFYHTLEVVDNIKQKTDNLWLIWAALLHDIAKPQTKKFEKGIGFTFHGHEFLGGKMIPRIFKKLKLPLNEKMRYVQKIVSLHLRPIVLSQDIVTDSAVRRLLFDAGDEIDDLMTLCEADITSKNPHKVKKYLNNFKSVRKKLRDVEERDHIKNWQPPIDGNEIMKLFKINEGKTVGVLKNSLKDAILDGKIKNEKNASIKFLEKEAKKIQLS